MGTFTKNPHVNTAGISPEVAALGDALLELSERHAPALDRRPVGDLVTRQLVTHYRHLATRGRRRRRARPAGRHLATARVMTRARKWG